jgi:1,2-diacylglycerol 3-alpha-glucosyltransferase
MRVGIFTESYPPLINGVSTSVQTLIAELERAGHSVCVFTSRYPRYKDDRPDVYRYLSVNAIVEPDYYIPIPFSARIKATIPKLGLDIVHSQSPFSLGMIARHIAQQQGLPLVSTNHTLYTEYAHYMPLLPASLVRYLLVRHMRRYYDSCDHVLAPSELTRHRLIDGYGVTAPVTVVPTGIPAPPYILAKPADTKRELGLPPDARLLLYVGRLAPEKNLEMLLKAFDQIAAKTEDTYLVVAGSGKSASSLKRFAGHLAHGSRVKFTGFLGRTKLDPLYKASELFLFPSMTETQGLAVGEALAAGTPAIVVNGGGAPEAVRDGVNGYIVEDEPDLMAEQTLCLLADTGLRRKMSAQARAGASEMTPDKVAGRIIALYESLLENKSRSPQFTGGDVGTRLGYEAPRDT